MTPERIDLARKGLSSDNPTVIVCSLKALGRFGKLTDLQALMNFIGSPNPRIKQIATEATSTLIKENLILHYHALDKTMRDKLGSLMQSIDPGVVDEIGKDLFSENDDRRLRAVQILGHIKKNQKIREILAKLLQDRNVKIKATAIKLLGKVIGPNDHDIILSLLNDGDKRVRANAIEALGHLGNKRCIPILLRFRRDPHNRIRGNVLKSLFQLGFTEIEPDLLEMLRSSNNLMKASALWVLSQIKITSTTLIDACGFQLLSSDEMVRRNARMVMKALETPRAKGYLRYLSDFLPLDLTVQPAGNPVEQTAVPDHTSR